MSVRELRVSPEVLALMGSGKFEVTANPLPADAEVTDVALDHHGQGDHCGTAPTIVLQITSDEFTPEEAGRPLLPMTFRRIL